MRSKLCILIAYFTLAVSAIPQTVPSKWHFSPAVKSPMDDRSESAMAMLDSETEFQGKRKNLRWLR